MSAPAFGPEEIAAVYRAIHERRDMRHFLPDQRLPLEGLVFENRGGVNLRSPDGA